MAVMPSFNSSVGSKSSGSNRYPNHHRSTISENGKKSLQSSWIRRLKPTLQPVTDKPPAVPENTEPPAVAVVHSTCTNSSGAVLGHRNTISTHESRTQTVNSNFHSALDRLESFGREESRRDCLVTGFGPFRVRTRKFFNNPNVASSSSSSPTWVRLPRKIVRVSQEYIDSSSQIEVKPDSDHFESKRFGFLDHESYREFYGDFPILERIVHSGEEERKSGFRSFGQENTFRNNGLVCDMKKDEGVVSSFERRIKQVDHGDSVIARNPVAADSVVKLSPFFRRRELLSKQDCIGKLRSENVDSDMVIAKPVTRIPPFSQKQELLLKEDCYKEQAVNACSNADWSEFGKWVNGFGYNGGSQKESRIGIGETIKSFGRLEGDLPYVSPSFHHLGDSINESLNMGNLNKFVAIPDDDSKNREPSGVIIRDGFPPVMFNGYQTSGFVRSTRDDHLLPMGEHKFMDYELNSHNLNHPWLEKTKLHILGDENKCGPSSRVPTIARDTAFDVPDRRQFKEQLSADPWCTSIHETKCISRSTGAANHDKLEGTACRKLWDSHPLMHHNMISSKREGRFPALPDEGKEVFSMWCGMERSKRVKNLPSVSPVYGMNKSSRKRNTDSVDIVSIKSRKLEAENY